MAFQNIQILTDLNITEMQRWHFRTFNPYGLNITKKVFWNIQIFKNYNQTVKYINA